jgi:hypothetical protein
MEALLREPLKRQEATRKLRLTQQLQQSYNSCNRATTTRKLRVTTRKLRVAAVGAPVRPSAQAESIGQAVWDSSSRFTSVPGLKILVHEALSY